MFDGEDSIAFEYIGETPSVNNMYSDIIRKSKKGRHFVRRIINSKSKAMLDEFTLTLNSVPKLRICDWYRLEMTFNGPMRFKNGNICKWDATNYIKPLEDLIAKHMGIDDKHNREIIIRKCNADRRSINIRMEALGNGYD